MKEENMDLNARNQELSRLLSQKEAQLRESISQIDALQNQLSEYGRVSSRAAES